MCIIDYPLGAKPLLDTVDRGREALLAYMMNTLYLKLRKKKEPDPSYFLEGPPLSIGGSLDQEL